MTEPTGLTTRRSTTRAEKEASGTPETKGAFPYQKYIEHRDGLPYLPLKWRLAWLRSDHPQAKISTKLTSHQDGVAIFKAVIELPEGAVATGWGAKGRSDSDDPHGQSERLDYVVLAENQALGRALAALGYGTEYAVDFDPPAENQSIPLPDRIEEEEAEDEPGIEVQISDYVSAAPSSNGQRLVDEDEDEDDEEEDDGEVEPAPRGEVRALFEKRPAFQASRPAPAPAEVTPPARSEDAPRPGPVPPKPAPAVAEKPAPTSLVPAGIEDRIKNIRDEALRLNVKQIYHEARQRYSYDEARVDNRSKELYGKPAYELDADEAREYLERILNPPKRR